MDAYDGKSTKERRRKKKKGKVESSAFQCSFDSRAAYFESLPV